MEATDDGNRLHVRDKTDNEFEKFNKRHKSMEPFSVVLCNGEFQSQMPVFDLRMSVLRSNTGRLRQSTSKCEKYTIGIKLTPAMMTESSLK